MLFNRSDCGRTVDGRKVRVTAYAVNGCVHVTIHLSLAEPALPSISWLDGSGHRQAESQTRWI